MLGPTGQKIGDLYTSVGTIFLDAFFVEMFFFHFLEMNSRFDWKAWNDSLPEFVGSYNSCDTVQSLIGSAISHLPNSILTPVEFSMNLHGS